MQREVNVAAVPEQARADLAALCRRYRVRDLALFGSAAGAGFDPGTSDLDLLVTFEPMPPTEHMQSYFGLLEALEALLRREVDLVELASIRNPYILESILKSKVDLYAAA
jgi:uncharacterized protein